MICVTPFYSTHIGAYDVAVFELADAEVSITVIATRYNYNISAVIFGPRYGFGAFYQITDGNLLKVQ